MKKIMMALAVWLGIQGAYAQNGLENIVVEKYYVSNVADAIGSNANFGGNLPIGAVTYRIYADMLPGYKFQALYGVPGHALVLNTTTSFFNNEDRGSYKPNWTKAQAADNSVMLDSYFTVGGATLAGANSCAGIFKTEDDGVANIVNSNGILANNDPSAGIPLTTQDGFILSSVQDPTFVGLTAGDLAMFDNTNGGSNSFSTTNGSIAALTGAMGTTAANRVLIAQITTTGILHYEFNVQIGTPTGGVQNFVASNPGAGEIQLASCTGNLGVTLASEPTSIGNITFASITSGSLTANFTSGNGAKRVVVARAGGAVNSNPVDGSTYSANAAFGSGAVLGSGNYVVYNGTGNSVVVTGLTAGTTYHFAVYEYNDGGQAGGENYRTATFANGNATTSSSGTTYVFNQSGAGPFSFTTAANWTPARTAPSTNDVLVFNAGGNVVVNGVVSQTIANLQVTNATQVTLQGLSACTLTINGNTAANDLLVSAGSSLNFNTSASVSVVLGSAATGSVFGNVTTSTSNTFQGGAASSLRFKSGSNFATATGFTGNAFGIAAPINSAVFESGATYTHGAGSAPFVASAPSSVVQFQSGSNQIWNTASGFDLDGRTYANLTIGATVTVSNSGNAAVANFTQSSAGTFTVNQTAGAVLTISGDVSNNSTNAVTINNGSVSFTKSGNQVVAGTGAYLFNTNSASGVTVGASTTLSSARNLVFNNLTLNGNLRFNAANLTHTIDGSVGGSGQFLPFGTFDGSLNYTGSGSIGNLKFGGSGMRNLTITRPGSTVDLTHALGVFGLLTLNGTNLNANNFLTLKSNASRTGCIPGNNTGAINGDITVERYVASGTTHLISSPVTGSSTASSGWGDDFNVAGTYPYVYNSANWAPQPAVFPTVWTYNEAHLASPFIPGWESAFGATLTSGKGFFANFGSPHARVIDAVGSATSGTVSIPVTNTNDGFNLIGNPYPSPIRWSLFKSLNPSLGAAYYVWSPVSGNYGYYNGVIGTLGATDTIYTSQGFFVQASGAATLTANNSIRFGSSLSTFFSAPISWDNLIKIGAKQGSNYDEAILYQTNRGHEGYVVEGDAIRVPAQPGQVAPTISIMAGNRAMAIKEIGSLEEGVSIPLSVETFEDGVVTLYSAGKDRWNTEAEAVLVDVVLNTRTVLNKGEAQHVALSKGKYDGRFFLNFEPTGSTASSASVETWAANAQKGMINLIYSGESTAFQMEMVDLAGRVIFRHQGAAQAGVQQIAVPQTAQGVYLVRLQTLSGAQTLKILLP